MYDIQTDQTSPVNIFAGDFPIVTEVAEVVEDATIRKLAPVVLTDDGAAEATAATIDKLHGIAAEESTDGGVVVYLTGEFFAAALTLPQGVTVAALKPAFRKLGIFLK